MEESEHEWYFDHPKIRDRGRLKTEPIKTPALKTAAVQAIPDGSRRYCISVARAHAACASEASLPHRRRALNSLVDLGRPSEAIIS